MLASSPSKHLESDAGPRRNPRSRVKLKKSRSKSVRNVLREAAAPLTIAQMAAAVVLAVGIQEADLTVVRKGVGSSVRNLKRRGQADSRQDETEASISSKLARGTFAATFFIAAMAAMGLEGVQLGDL